MRQSRTHALRLEKNAPTASRLGCRGSRCAKVELHFRRHIRTFFGGKVRLLFEAEQACQQNRWESFCRGVVLCDGFIETAALDGNAVLCSLELSLQIAKVAIRLQLRISLRDHEQSRKDRTQPGLGLLVL